MTKHYLRTAHWFPPIVPALLTVCVAVTTAAYSQDEESSGRVASGGIDEPNQFWTIDFKPQGLKMFSPRRGVGAGRVYWYLVYTIHNKADEDREINVNVTATARKRLYASLFLPSVERFIERKEQKPLWGKTDEFKILAKRDPEDPKYSYVTLKAGERRTCVAIFNEFDPLATAITVNVTGLSNDIVQVTRADGTIALSRRVRELSYERLGDEFAVTLDSFRLKGKRWVKHEIPLTVSEKANTPTSERELRGDS